MIKLADIFQSGMTLQRDEKIALFGKTDKALEIEVKINGEKVGDYSVDGDFVVYLPAQKATFDAIVEIIGDETITLNNVDIGDVWIAGGQSNMEFLLKYDETYNKNGHKVKEDEHNRFYDVPEYAYPEEAEWGLKTQYNVWRKLSNDYDSTMYFCAAGKYFAEELRNRYPDVPVAIVGCNWGGTLASAWTDRETLLATPELKGIVDDFDKNVRKNRDELLVSAKSMAERTAKATGKGNGISDKIMFGKFNVFEKLLMKSTMKMYGKMIAKNAAQGPSPLWENRPSGLYENMLLKIAPMSAKGVIWYQGESDNIRPTIYDISFTKVIESWRKTFNKELPFYFVQLAPFGYWFSEANNGKEYPTLRDCQKKVEDSGINAHMVSISDAGMQFDIHPKNKEVVGKRLALSALRYTYGEDVDCQAPEVDKVERNGNEIAITFKNVYGGLNLNGDKVNDLELFDCETPVDYDFTLDNDTLVLKGNFENKKLTVNYMHKAYYECNLYNSANIPAIPFIKEV